MDECSALLTSVAGVVAMVLIAVTSNEAVALELTVLLASLDADKIGTTASLALVLDDMRTIEAESDAGVSGIIGILPGLVGVSDMELRSHEKLDLSVSKKVDPASARQVGFCVLIMSFSTELGMLACSHTCSFALLTGDGVRCNIVAKLRNLPPRLLRR